MGLILGIAIFELLLVGGAIFFFVKKSAGGGGGQAIITLKEQLEKVRSYRSRLEALYSELIELPGLALKVREVKGLQDAVKSERGRITITQAELETIETRLRELEEIERELEASGIETKEELNILKKKEKELANKNEALRNQIAMSTEQVDSLMGQIQASAQVMEQVQAMKNELIQSEMKITEILVQIEQGNDQYFLLKQRYDALDIEYAQLYEKFSEAEAMMGQSKPKEE
jgi:chromosome segregation ATPase